MQLAAGSYSGRRQVQGLVIGLVFLAIIWALAAWIVAGSDKNLVMFGLGLVFCALVAYIQTDWRSGVLLFLVWLLFDDLARKYLGNNMIVYFAKDAIVGACYVSYYMAKRRGRVAVFKIPFLVPLAVFFGFAVIQVFNTQSPSILYGLLGLKSYFYYAPLMLLGYAMVDRPADLDRFLVINLVAGTVIAGLGVAESILGTAFLTPDDIAPEFYALTHVVRHSPVTNLISASTSSVFVSSGRFSFYLILLWILVMGAIGYMLLSRRPAAKYGFLGMGVVTVAVLITGTRTPFIFVVASALIMTVGFLWGAPWSWGQGHRLVKALRRAFLVGAIGVILMAEVFPLALGGRWNFLAETLSYSGQGSDLQNRGWDYPTENLRLAFNSPCWLTGCGTGTNSLGLQYVARLLDRPFPSFGVESGYGGLIIEMGIGGLALWVIWVSALLWSGWRIVKQLRQTVYFPIGFAIWWYALVLLVLIMYLNLGAYQNFVNNAFLWLLLGVLFRLPKLAQMPQPVPIPRHLRAVPRWRLALGGR
jgi:hypothetical protein